MFSKLLSVNTLADYPPEIPEQQTLDCMVSEDSDDFNAARGRVQGCRDGKTPWMRYKKVAKFKPEKV